MNGNLLYLIALIIVIGWAIAIMGYHAGSYTHVLLAVAAVIIIYKISQERKA